MLGRSVSGHLLVTAFSRSSVCPKVCLEQITAHAEQNPEAAGITAEHQVPREERREAQPPGAAGTVLPNSHELENEQI